MAFCRQCGTRLESDDRFCPACGRSIAQVSPTRPRTPKKKASLWLWVVGLLVLLWLIGSLSVGPILNSAKNDETLNRFRQNSVLSRARRDFINQHNDAARNASKVLGDSGGGGECKLGPEDTTLVCKAYNDGSRLTLDSQTLDDLCGRGFIRVIVAGSERILNCGGIPPYHIETNQYGVDVYKH